MGRRDWSESKVRSVRPKEPERTVLDPENMDEGGSYEKKIYRNTEEEVEKVMSFYLKVILKGSIEKDFKGFFRDYG